MNKENYEPCPEKEITTVGMAVECFLDGDTASTIKFLKAHKDETAEFCLQLQDSYQENDRRTPVIRLSMLIEELL